MMLAFEVEFLTGRCVATDRENRLQAEWPPHPARFYAALAAAHFERKEDLERETEEEREEREALEWLERQPDVALAVPDGYPRTNTLVFVPVNDSDMTGNKGSVFPRIGEGWEFRRNRQARVFPTVAPDPPVLHYIWQNADAAQIARRRPALERLAANVTYLGHSSSLVRVSISEDRVRPTLRPAQANEPADAVLRVPERDRLTRLGAAYALSRAQSRRIEPPQSAERRYVRADTPQRRHPPQTLFDDRMLVFEKVDGRRLPLHAALALTDTVRKALIRLADPAPESLSGHQPDGSKSNHPHVAVVPLAFVDHRYGDGDVKGFALVLPRFLREPERRSERVAILRAAARLQKLTLGRAGVWCVEEVSVEETQLRTLDPRLWTQPSKTWATATPVVFGRFPKCRSGKVRGWMQSEEVEQMIREHCEMIELCDANGEIVYPTEIVVSDVSPLLGVAPAVHFPTLSTDGKPVFREYNGANSGSNGAKGRLRAHVKLRFAEPVRGPLLLGAGRYLGMGFCKPVRS
jgi:CRISPR-associated protein Csb2